MLFTSGFRCRLFKRAWTRNSFWSGITKDFHNTRVENDLLIDTSNLGIILSGVHRSADTLYYHVSRKWRVFKCLIHYTRFKWAVECCGSSETPSSILVKLGWLWKTDAGQGLDNWNLPPGETFTFWLVVSINRLLPATSNPWVFLLRVLCLAYTQRISFTHVCMW